MLNINSYHDRDDTVQWSQFTISPPGIILCLQYWVSADDCSQYEFSPYVRFFPLFKWGLFESNTLSKTAEKVSVPLFVVVGNNSFQPFNKSVYDIYSC